MKRAFEYIDSEGGHILVAHHVAPDNHSELMAQTKYDGIELHNVAHEFKNNPKHDVRFTQPYSERNAVAYMLVTAGYYKSNLISEKPPLPDVRVELSGGSIVYVETAEVIESPSARFEGVLQFVNVGVAKARDEDSTLDKKLTGHAVNVRAWMTKSGEYDARAILDEFLTFLRDVDFATLPVNGFTSFPKQYAALESIDAKFSYSPVTFWTLPRFAPHANAYAPESLAGQVLATLEQKRRKRYAGSPLWLALYMTDMLGVPEHSLDVLHGVPLDFLPFDKLLVGDQRDVLVYTRERHSRNVKHIFQTQG